MVFQPGRKAIRLVVALALGATGLVLTPVGPATAAGFSQVPERLYMAPAGVSLPVSIAEFIGVEVGSLRFNGDTDPISQDVRTIEVVTIEEDTAEKCDLIDEVVGVKDYDIEKCSRVQILASHGRITMGALTTLHRDYLTDPDGGGPINAGDENPNDPVYRYDGGSGAVLDIFGGGDPGSDTNPNHPNGFLNLQINGTQDQLNAALANLVYTPDADYYYDGSNGASLDIDVISGDPDPNSPLTGQIVEIRVLNVNQFPSITVPGDKSAQAGVELLVPTVTPPSSIPYTGTEFAVTDPDNDEDVDGAQANPPETEDPLVDGAGDKMLLVGYLDCGTATTDGVNGFNLRGGTFLASNNDIEETVQTFYDYTNMPQAGKDGIDAALALIDAVAPGLINVPLATSSPTEPTHLFAGIATMSQVQYALSQLTFLIPTPNDTCTMWTIVSDLGNNGLPLQYFGSPPTGVELPMIGVAFDSFDITTGALDEIDISFDAEPIVILEGDPGDAVATAEASFHISPATHPKFTIVWEANPRVGDVILPGQAEPNVDFAGGFNNSVEIPENATDVTVLLYPALNLPDKAIFNDDLDEGVETFTYDLVLDENEPPPGYVVVSSVASRTVMILDDDDAAATLTVVDAPSVVEGDAGDTTLTFTLTLDKPADGNESVDVVTNDGAATSPADFDAIPTTTINFTPGATTATVVVTVHGDLLDEGNHSFTLDLSNPVNLTLNDSSGVGTITDDDASSVVSIADATVTEGGIGNQTTISMTNFAGRTCQVTVTSADVSATDPDDYSGFSGGFFNVVNMASDVLAITVVNDPDPEPPETFTLTIALEAAGSDPQCALGDSVATITILDNDSGDATPPTVTIDQGGTQVDPTSVSPIVFDVVFSEPVFGFTAADISFAGSTAPGTLVAAIMGAGPAYTVEVSGMTGGGTVVASIPGGSVLDGNSNPNDASTSTDNSVTFEPADVIPPTVTIDQGGSQADPTSVSPIVFDVVFSEPVTGFDPADISFAGSTAPGTLLATILGAGPAYTVQVTGMTGDGTVVASIPDGSVLDGNSNPNDASTSTDNSVTFEVVDMTPPTVTIEQGGSQVDPTSVSPIVFDVVFSEPVVGFDGTDITLSGTAGATAALVSGVGPAYTVSVSGMTQDGTVIADVDAAAAVDAGGNPSLASTSSDNEVTFDFNEGDVTPPTVTINQGSLQVDPTGSSPIVFDVVFSEPVVGFVGTDVSLSGTAGATTAVVAGAGAAYTVSVSGMTGAGTVIATLIAGAAADAANNPSLASTSTDNTVTYTQSGPAPIVLTLPANITKNNDLGMIGAVVTYPAPTATGGIPPITILCSPASGSFFPLGTTTVTCTATDSAVGDQQVRFVEATTSGTFTVTVVDAELPVIAKPPDLTRESSNGKPVPVTFVTPAATDNAGPPVVTCVPASGSSFNLGVTTVTCTATDAAGNKASSTFTVTVTSPASGVPVTGSSPATTLAIAMALVVAGWLCLGVRRRGVRT